ncbi:putative Glucan endo-1,3-beta-glucosidase [Melia azedarach]|uniref:Glucan endo-1,3-beta-glucosidase n=1 Tax=Melia azedarach TaxID=155640 RepID=A0ACC1Y9B7_MELAZ|nr:putative Glucan endo-1,3-beta-glucosidase [Melia azedarach]
MASTINIFLFTTILLAAAAFSTGVSHGTPDKKPIGKANGLNEATLLKLHEEGRLPKGVWRRMHRDKKLKHALQTGAPLPPEYNEILAGIIGPNGKIGNGKKLNPKAAEKPKKPPVTRGKKYCVPKPEVNDQVLQANIDWACKNGVDCDPLVNMKEISCADQSLRTKAGYVMNYYYNANGRNESTCDFNHSAMLTLENPSK